MPKDLDLKKIKESKKNSTKNKIKIAKNNSTDYFSANDFFLTDDEKRLCVLLAKKSIIFYLENNSLLKLGEKEVSSLPKKLLEKKACFVTLKIGEELRGCIGNLEAVQPLYIDIIENSFNAAFRDPRFFPLKQKEFDELEVEVSILTDPVDLSYSSANDLLKKIVAGEDGLIISKNYSKATFLPSVWEELPKKEDFLSHLCLKAGLASEEWKKGTLKIKRYYAIKA